MSHLADDRKGMDQPRMVGRLRHVELPLLRGLPDPAEYCEHLAVDGRRVFVSKQVLRDLVELEQREHPVETAGLLFGGHFSDGRYACTVVAKLVEPLPGDVLGTRSTVTITPAGADSMLRRAAREEPVLAPVGWAHTHPSFEAYFSEVDRAEQRAWRSAGSVGLVLSGLLHARPRYRVFVGPESTAADRRSTARAVHSSVAEPEVRSTADHGIEAGPAETPVSGHAEGAGRARRRCAQDLLQPRRRRRVSQRTAPPHRARTVRSFRRDAFRPVVVTRVTACAVVGALLASLAISLCAMRLAHDARQTPRPATALGSRPDTGAAVGAGAARANPVPLRVLSGAELRWVK